jgi:hypothetical protein
MALLAVVGGLLGLLGVVCAVVGIFALEGISIEFWGIILGGLGYYLGLTSQIREKPDPGHRRCGTQRDIHDHKRPFGTAAVVHGGRVHPTEALPALTSIGLESHPISRSYG